MKTTLNRIPVAIGLGLVAGFAGGTAVALAMGWSLHLYLRFIAVSVVAAVVVVGVCVYRRFVQADPPVGEEASDGR